MAISRATTLRSFLWPQGRQDLECVAQGNCMAARAALICCLVTVLGGVWVVEQPSTSLLFRHPRLQWLCKLMPVTSLDNVSGILAWQCIQDHIGRRSLTSLAQVYRCNFWMLFFKSPSPKRTSLWSSSSQIKRFWLGKLTKKIREDHKKQNPDFATVIKYVDKAGRKRYHGSKQLRSTQTLDSFKTE